MKNQKKLAPLFLGLTLLLLFPYLIREKSKTVYQQEEHSHWQVISKNQNKNIMIRKANDNEVSWAQRGPASKKQMLPMKKNFFALRDIDDGHPHWQHKLGKHLTKFQPEGTQIYLYKKKAFLFPYKNKKVPAAEVIVKYLLPQNKKRSFVAIVDLDTGKVLQTFFQTIQN